MSKPQQPELHRSGRGASDPGAVKNQVGIRQSGKSKGRAHPVPEANQPGHHPDHEQDRPVRR